MTYVTMPAWELAVREYAASANRGQFFSTSFADYEIEHVVTEATKLLTGTKYPAPKISEGDDNAMILTWTAGGHTVELQLGEILINLAAVDGDWENPIDEPTPAQMREALDALYPELKVPLQFIPIADASRRIGCDAQWLMDSVVDGKVAGRIEGTEILVSEDEVNTLISELYGVPALPCPYCEAPAAACGSKTRDARTPICRWIELHKSQVAQAERERWAAKLKDAASTTRESARLSAGTHAEYPSDGDASNLLAGARLMILADAYETAAKSIEDNDE